MVDKVLYARGAQTRLEEALADTPVVLDAMLLAMPR